LFWSYLFSWLSMVLSILMIVIRYFFCSKYLEVFCMTVLLSNGLNPLSATFFCTTPTPPLIFRTSGFNLLESIVTFLLLSTLIADINCFATLCSYSGSFISTLLANFFSWLISISILITWFSSSLVLSVGFLL